MLGEPFNAARAGEIGLVTAVPGAELMARANETAQKLARKPATALRACKDLLKSSEREQLKRSVAREMEEFAARVRSADAKEAITAFFEKRPPDFSRTKQQGSRRSRRPETGCREAIFGTRLCSRGGCHRSANRLGSVSLPSD